MKRNKKIYLILFVIMPIYSYGQNPEIMDVIQKVIIDKNVDYNIQSWLILDELSINWENNDITWNEDLQSYYKKGSINLDVDGKNYGEWVVILIGPRAGINNIVIFKSHDQRLEKLNVQKLLDKRGIQSLQKECDNMASFGKEFWIIKPIDKIFSYLSYEWSCGSEGCDSYFELSNHLNDINNNKCN